MSLAAVHELPRAERRTRGVVRRDTLADIATSRLRWMSKSLALPSQGLVVIGARGGSAKSSLALEWAARTTLGTFDSDQPLGPRDVCVIAHEDPFSSIVIPRLIAAGADLTRVHRLTVAAASLGVATVPRIPRDLVHIRAELIATESKVLLIDPATSVLEGDNDKLGDVRLMVDALASVAEELDVLVILIVHFNKTRGARSGDRMSGSHAYRDAARTVFEMSKDPTTETIVVTREKGNYTRTADDSFAFRLESVSVPTDDGEVADVARVVWLGRSERSVDDIETEAAATNRFGDLRAGIRSMIARGTEPVPVSDIEAAFPDAAHGRIRQTLTRLVQSGHIERAGRGLYKTTNSTAPTERTNS